jgi:hypothetical protein
MITALVLLTVLAVGGVLYAGIGIAFALATIALKLVWLGLHFIFSLGWAALAVAAAAVFLILKLSGLVAIAGFVLLLLALVWAVGTLLGANRHPSLPHEVGEWSLRSKLERFDRRLRNIETIVSAH